MSRRLKIPALAFALWLVAAQAAGQENAVLSEMDFDRSTPVRMTPVCGFPGLTIPPEAKIYAVGGYRGGRNLGWKIGPSHHPAKLSQVVVNSPDEPVVLMLGAYEPTIWEVGWTEGTVILAALVAGHQTQGLSGLPPHVPTLVSSYYPDYGPCPPFHLSADPEQIKKADELALKVFQRRPDEYFKSADVQYVVVGRPLAAGQKAFMAKALVREDFELPGSGLTGRAALGAMLRAGLIRPATATEMNRWREKKAGQRRAVAQAEGRPEPSSADDYGLAGLNADNAFVIVDERKFYCPEGLAEPITVFLPAGLRVPQARLEPCRLFFLDNGTCRGQACP